MARMRRADDAGPAARAAPTGSGGLAGDAAPTGDAGLAGDAAPTGSGGLAEDAGLAEVLGLLAAAGVPADEVLSEIHLPGGPERMMQRLVEAGLLPSRDESLAGLLAMWKPLLRRDCDPWRAELAGVEFLGVVRDAAASDEEVPELLADLIAQVGGYGGGAALAMLRVLAVVGPAPVRPAAAEAADRVAATGVPDRPWVRGLGAPDVGACFGYVDSAGGCEAVAVTFAYGRREHALAVLVDHECGGGIKDCWPTDRPDLVRADFQRAADRYGLSFHEYELVDARAILDRALRRRPCPATPDQAEDVRDHLDLLRSRVALLPAGGSPPDAAARGVVAVHRVKVTLRGTKPPVWRRLEVPSGLPLRRLHRCVRAVFGGEDRQAWLFRTPAGAYGVADRARGHRSAQSTTLAEVAPHVRDVISYEYGDREHRIVVEDVVAAEPGTAYPRCLTGRGAGSAGVAGGFDADAANRALARLAAVLIPA
ncbi:plasmid pRiA4b ORF-3 family protein [Planosporangium sp. 12N6]|uniref:plasmid pRiA4b ORF-3 family protein n=1 Tax=Planosporangium spinosum TaxID=3402278 RepID=UPI003CED4822